METIKKVILFAALVCALSACGSDDDAPAIQQYAGAPTVKALPITVESAMRNGAFQGDLKLATIGVGVDGGSSKEWTATGIAVAEKIAGQGVDSVEVSVRRNDIHEKQGVRFREVAHVYYSPDPAHSVWRDGQKWKILQADPSGLSTQKDVDLYEDYDALHEGYIEKDMDSDLADKKAGAAIAKKYHLQADWSLPSGNDMNPEVQRSSMNIDDSAAVAGIAPLDACLKDQLDKIFVRCDGGSGNTSTSQ
ncbi:hypothetical protein [Rhodanobacter sp. MP1X3]|uniref:hypothetical protein n=1 Tax=Rhodanobacter sp. MP1X3 TaxID=2723086 RepID=UPI0016217A54|nr:hypothetical protein [Rhodanobacter sp. MP1X3]MBB6242988.1 hypothetical protein [Rhodanobacter sp. MP1X3]